MESEKGVHFYSGLFPESAQDFNEQCCLVHCDVDYYASTKAVLEYFWHRLPLGGLVICDDYGYGSCPGAKLACDEFLRCREDFTKSIWRGALYLEKK